MKVVLTIAGSDCSGGAGIQADLKTIAAHGLYGESAITALTAQNTVGVAGVYPVPLEILEMQLESVFTDIVPDAVKVGMIPGVAQMKAVRECLEKYHAAHVVMDTVMVSTSGKALMEPEALGYFTEALLPLAEIITPNLPEAERLLGHEISGKASREEGAGELSARYGAGVYLKGGHDPDRADDLFIQNGKARWLRGEHIPSGNTHGTGCTLSSAIACGLALGLTAGESARRAKEYITGAIADGLDLGKGNGPLNHFYGRQA